MDHDFGKILQKARTDRALSVEHAAQAVRMRAAYVRALENSDLTKFPNAAYAKSFLLLYSRFLGVDMKSVAAQIDTTTQMKVEGYQYLTSRAAAQPKSEPEPELTFSMAPAPKTSGTWLPLIVLGGTVALVGAAFIFWQNINRLGGAGPVQPAATPAPAASAAAAIEPVAAVPKAVSSQLPEPAPVTPPPAAPAPDVEETPPPRPVVVALPPGAAAVPPEGNPEIPKARPISPVAKMAAADSELLAGLGPPKPRVVQTPAQAAPPPVAEPPPAGEENALPDEDANAIILEPRRKTWVVIRTGPGGQPLFEDYLYTTAKPLRLPAGRYFIELKDADAVEISRNGRRIGYSAPGVVVE